MHTLSGAYMWVLIALAKSARFNIFCLFFSTCIRLSGAYMWVPIAYPKRSRIQGFVCAGCSTCTFHLLIQLI